MDIRIEVNLSKPQAMLELLSHRGQDFRPALREFHAYMTRQTDLMFERAGGPGSALIGGSYRGIYWRPFSPQYLRADGTLVPAWGGVDKVRGRGQVKGRKRPSGQRVTLHSLLMQDTGRLRSRATTGMVRLTPRSIEFGPNLEYAAHQNAMRPFLFVTAADTEAMVAAVARHLLGGDDARRPER